jgi:hypothetical protein
MEVDAGLWALLACIIGFITFGCFMTATKVGLENFGDSARKQPPDHGC